MTDLQSTVTALEGLTRKDEPVGSALSKSLSDLTAATTKLSKADSYLPGQMEMFGDAPPPPKPSKKKKTAATPTAQSGAAEASAKVDAVMKAFLESAP